jgi:shikimate kinase
VESSNAPSDQFPPRWRRIVLLGFMTSGKTEVGSALAARLGWQHVDLDREIEHSTGKSIEQIFATGGEPAFRALEIEHTARFVNSDRIVFSPGGGWITNPGLFERLPPDTLTVWLKVSPAEILRRLRGAQDQPVRPLLLAPDPLARINQLLGEREPLYRRSVHSLDTDGHSVAEIVDDLVRVADDSNSTRTKTKPEYGA